MREDIKAAVAAERARCVKICVDLVKEFRQAINAPPNPNQLRDRFCEYHTAIYALKEVVEKIRGGE